MWSASLARSAARTADSAWVCTTLRTSRSRATSVKIGLHSLGRRPGVGGRPDDRRVRRRRSTNRSSAPPVPCGPRSGPQQVAVSDGPQMPPPVPETQPRRIVRTQLLHEELARLEVRHRCAARRPGRGPPAMDAGYGARSTPASVMKPVMSAAGVTSKAGFQTRRVNGRRQRRTEVHAPRAGSRSSMTMPRHRGCRCRTR